MASRPDGHEFEQALGDGEEQGSLECCIQWGCKESETTEELNTIKEQHPTSLALFPQLSFSLEMLNSK